MNANALRGFLEGAEVSSPPMGSQSDWCLSYHAHLCQWSHIWEMLFDECIMEGMNYLKNSVIIFQARGISLGCQQLGMPWIMIDMLKNWKCRKAALFVISETFNFVQNFRRHYKYIQNFRLVITKFSMSCVECLCSGPAYEKWIKKHGFKLVVCLHPRWSAVPDDNLRRRVLELMMKWFGKLATVEELPSCEIAGHDLGYAQIS